MKPTTLRQLIFALLLNTFRCGSSFVFHSLSSRSPQTTTSLHAGDQPILDRFFAPRIDDPGLPLSDALCTQIIAPSIQVFVLYFLHRPLPSWLLPLWKDSSSLLFNTYPAGSLVAPTLIHGAGLASIWLVSALAAKLYERGAISPIRNDDANDTWDYSIVLGRLSRAGACAVGLLILATQFHLYLEFGSIVQWGDDPVSDVRIGTAMAEVVYDSFFEGVTIGVWRLYLAYQTERLHNVS